MIIGFPPFDRYHLVEVSPMRPHVWSPLLGFRRSFDREPRSCDHQVFAIRSPSCCQGESNASTCLQATCYDHDLIQTVWCSLTRSTAPFSACAPDDDPVDSGPLDRRALCEVIRIQRLRCAHMSCEDKFPRVHCPARKKRERISSIKGGAAKRICVTAPNS